MVLFETTLIAGISSLVLSAEISPWGIEWKPAGELVVTTLSLAAAWTVVAAAFMHAATGAFRSYAVSILVDTGLLYLALEHEPADVLAPLRRAEKVLRLSPASAPSALSFRQRITAFMRRFGACASAIGFYPQPAPWRMLRSVLLALSFGLALIFGWIAFSAYGAARLELPYAGLPLKVSGTALVWSIMASTLLTNAQRNAPPLALAEVLLGDDYSGSAIRAGKL